ncbi:MAG: GNAT family N-acetyltransferase [Thermoguttaceae bacterium]|jgi:ribosomal protein S18 acetylase RimI-like enzyme
MVSDNSQSVLICPVLPEDRSAALDLTFIRLPSEERGRQIETILSASAADKLPWEGLMGAYRSGRLVGSIFSQILPGKSAQVWLPRLLQNEATSTAIVLLRATVGRLDRQVRMAQILMETVTAEEENILCKGGFDYLTDLLYLVCQEDDFPLALLPCPLEFEAYNSQNHDRLARIVDATYQDTLDCPKLNQVRQLDDVLAGYRATGEFSPGRWLIVCYENRDVGCLLLADHPRYENMELVYMGVIPAVRGRHWGTDIARHAQWVARQAGRLRLVLAVDASNLPAIEMYASVGFRTWDQRRVYYQIFSTRDSLPAASL